MKRLLFFLVSLCVIAGGFFVWRTVSNKQTSIPSERTEAQNNASFTVTPLSYQVYTASASNPSDFSEIQQATLVQTGAHIKTNATGRALVEGIHNTLLDTNTQITLEQADPITNQTKIKLEIGNIWSRIQKLTDKGQYYEIETQNARASVRGTSFGMFVRGKETWLMVTDGAVRFVPLKPTTREEVASKITIVSAGYMARITEAGDLLLSSLSSVDKSDAWFIYNNQAQKPEDQKKANTAPATTDTPTSSIPSAGSASGSMTGTVVQPSTPTQTPAPAPAQVPTPTVAPTPTITTTPSSGSTNTSTSSGTITSTPVTTTPNKTITPATPETPELILSSATPNSILENTSVRLVLKGIGFVNAQVRSLTIGSVIMTDFSVQDDTTIILNVPVRTLYGGVYDVNVFGANQSSATLRGGLVVTK